MVVAGAEGQAKYCFFNNYRQDQEVLFLGGEKNRIPDQDTSEASKQSTWQESQDFSTSTMPYRDKDTKS
jgi:hypothetical protein